MANDKAVLKKVAALADSSALPEYQGKPTVRTTISLRNTGDGLSESMAVDPILYDVGSTQYVLTESVVKSHDFTLNESGEAFELDQVFKGGLGMVIDPDLVQDVVTAQRERIRQARDAATGTMELPLGDGTGDGEGDTPPDEGSTRRRPRKAAAKKAAAKPKGS